MLPTLKPGDRVLVSSVPYLFSQPKTGDLIIFKHDKLNIIKRIVKISGEKVFLAGDNRSDSLEIPPIEKNKILGKVVKEII